MVQIAIDDDTRTWRDVADQLPDEMVVQLERAEELEAAGVKAWECGPADNAALMLHFGIAKGIAQHQAGVRFADIPTPEWVTHAEPWENIGSDDDPDWSRRLEGPRYPVVGELGQVLIEGFQQAADGSIQWGVRVAGDAEDWMAPAVACCLAGALTRAAGALENMLAGSASEVAAGPLGGGV